MLNFYYPFSLGRCFIRRCCSLKCVKETVSSCTQTPTESGGGASHVCHRLADVPVQPPSSFQHFAQSLGSLFLLWFVFNYIFARFKGALTHRFRYWKPLLQYLSHFTKVFYTHHYYSATKSVRLLEICCDHVSSIKILLRQVSLLGGHLGKIPGQLWRATVPAYFFNGTENIFHSFFS